MVAIIVIAARAAVAAPTRLWSRLRLVHPNGSIFHQRAVERTNGRASGVVVGHLHEAKALALAAVAVGDDPSLGNFAVGFEELSKLLVGGRIGQVSDVDASSHQAHSLGCGELAAWDRDPWA